MIDTIVIRIHNLTKYKKLYEQYYAPSEKNGAVTRALLDDNANTILENTLRPSVIFHDNNRCLPLSYRSSINLASSHYSIAVSINHGLDYLEFNFSVPKFLYGNNVNQFINMHDQGSYVTYLELLKFLAEFQRLYLIEIPLAEDFEINRIDLCYNQFFNSKEDSLSYLDEQKKLLVKYARSSKNNFRSYDTSLVYITRRYSFKIYHKGTEFRKNDYPKIANSGNPKNIPLQYYLDESDKILRYEMTFRRSQMNYLVNHYFAISKEKSLYHKYASHPVSKTLYKIVATGFPKLYEEYMSRSKRFCLASELDTTENFEVIAKSERVSFDNTIFSIFVDEFKAKIDQYQLKKRLDIGQVKQRIDKWNNDNQLKNKLRRKPLHDMNNSRLIVLAVLSQKLDNFKELQPYLNDRTYYRMVMDLKKIGITTNDTDLGFPSPRTDYLDYKMIFGRFH